MELPSAGLPFVNTRTRPAQLKPMAARNPATPLPMTRKSAARVGVAARRRGILAPPRSFALNPAIGHAEGRVSVHAAHGKDRKSTRLNSSHSQISYAVFCLKKKKQTILRPQ